MLRGRHFGPETYSSSIISGGGRLSNWPSQSSSPPTGSWPGAQAAPPGCSASSEDEESSRGLMGTDSTLSAGEIKKSAGEAGPEGGGRPVEGRWAVAWPGFWIPAVFNMLSTLAARQNCKPPRRRTGRVHRPASATYQAVLRAL